MGRYVMLPIMIMLIVFVILSSLVVVKTNQIILVLKKEVTLEKINQDSHYYNDKISTDSVIKACVINLDTLEQLSSNIPEFDPRKIIAAKQSLASKSLLSANCYSQQYGLSPALTGSIDCSINTLQTYAEFIFIGARNLDLAFEAHELEQLKRLEGMHEKWSADVANQETIQQALSVLHTMKGRIDKTLVTLLTQK